MHMAQNLANSLQTFYTDADVCSSTLYNERLSLYFVSSPSMKWNFPVL